MNPFKSPALPLAFAVALAAVAQSPVASAQADNRHGECLGNTCVVEICNVTHCTVRQDQYDWNIDLQQWVLVSSVVIEIRDRRGLEDIK
jgi:hypothetical protein